MAAVVHPALSERSLTLIIINKYDECDFLLSLLKERESGRKRGIEGGRDGGRAKC